MSFLTRLTSPDVGKSMFLMGMRASTLGIKLLLTLYVAKYLGLGELGVFGLLAAAQILLPAAASLGINLSLSRHVVTQGDDEIAAQTRGYLLVVLVFYALATAIAYAYFADRLTSETFWIATGLLLLENINSDAYHLLANQTKQVFANALHFVRSALWAVVYMALGFVDERFRTFDWLLVCWLAGSFAAFALLLVNMRRLPLFSSPAGLGNALGKLRQQIKESWFLYINGIVTSVGTQADRYIVTAVLGLEMTGVYVFYLQVSSALSNLHYTGLIQIQRPKVVIAARIAHRQFLDKVNAVVITALVTTVLSSIVVYFVVSAIIPMLEKPALSQWHVLLYFSLAAAIGNVVVEAQRLYFYALHEDRSAFYINLASSAIGIAMLFALLMKFGLMGGGVALVLASLVRIAMESGARAMIEKTRKSLVQ